MCVLFCASRRCKFNIVATFFRDINPKEPGATDVDAIPIHYLISFRMLEPCSAKQKQESILGAVPDPVRIKMCQSGILLCASIHLR